MKDFGAILRMRLGKLANRSRAGPVLIPFHHCHWDESKPNTSWPLSCSSPSATEPLGALMRGPAWGAPGKPLAWASSSSRPTALTLLDPQGFPSVLVSCGDGDPPFRWSLGEGVPTH